MIKADRKGKASGLEKREFEGGAYHQKSPLI
jgi:hypothetical protein